MYNFHLPITIDTSREYLLQGLSHLPSHEELAHIEAFVKSPNTDEAYAIVRKPAMSNDSNQVTYYCLETSGEFEDDDHGTSEILRFNKAIRTVADSLGRCGEEFFLVAIGKSVRCFYDNTWHPLVLKVLSNQHHNLKLL